MSKDNIEALKSSMLVGLAYGAIGVWLGLLHQSSHWLLAGVIGFISGLIIGLLTTWDLEE